MNNQGRRSLSFHEVRECETATSAPSECECRCGGAFHGASRGSNSQQEVGESFFHSLPVDDPHHLQTVQEKRARRSSSRREKRRAQFEAERAAFFARRDARSIAGEGNYG
jgi:hypothetical protein